MAKNSILKAQLEDSQKCLDAILHSTTKNKLIVAGPGTGKSYLFKKLFELKNGDNLALTFINNLARDLQKDLGELANASTFHGYCKKLLHEVAVDGIDTNFYYYPQLPILIENDSQLIGNNLNKFKEAFDTLIEDDRLIFYLERGNYYNAVSHSDAVYRVLKHFQANQDSLPSFCQIVVDEYQDFNFLEVAFIDELEKTSPILIAGDDDQAIYDFRDASPYHIRSKFAHPSFVNFELPYCRRCTQVIVQAVKDVATMAQNKKQLQGRIDKKFICFLPEKEVESEKHPKIIHAHCTIQTNRAPYVAKFIEDEINKIPNEEFTHANENGYPCVLILGPSHYTKQVFKYLETKFSNIDYLEKEDQDITALKGYEILLKDESSNLGWRIIMICFPHKEMARIIKETSISNTDLFNLLDSEYKKLHLNALSILEKIKNNDDITDDEKKSIIKKCGQSIEEIKNNLGVENETDAEEEEDTIAPIKITTINGSKGLSADYIFLIGMNNNLFPKNYQNPTENEICQFIVGLTRTRKKCYLISNSRFGLSYNINQSTFIDWINPSLINKITINADYFRNKE